MAPFCTDNIPRAYSDKNGLLSAGERKPSKKRRLFRIRSGTALQSEYSFQNGPISVHHFSKQMRVLRIGSPSRPDIRQDRKSVPKFFPFREREARHAYLAQRHQLSVLVLDLFLLDLKDSHLHGFPIGIKKFLQTLQIYKIRVKMKILIQIEIHNEIFRFYMRTFAFFHFLKSYR